MQLPPNQQQRFVDVDPVGRSATATSAEAAAASARPVAAGALPPRQPLLPRPESDVAATATTFNAATASVPGRFVNAAATAARFPPPLTRLNTAENCSDGTWSCFPLPFLAGFPRVKGRALMG